MPDPNFVNVYTIGLSCTRVDVYTRASLPATEVTASQKITVG